MSLRLKLRLIILVFALVASATLIIWSASAGLSRITEMEEGLRIAEQIDEKTVHLQAVLRVLEHQADPAQWQRFLAESRELEMWFTEQDRTLITARERKLLDRIEAEYAAFLSGATTLTGELGRRQMPDIEVLQERVIDLSDRLGAIRRIGVRQYLMDSHQYVALAHRSVIVLLAILVCVSIWLSLAVYRGMIAPLRTQLVQVGAALERSEKLASLGVLAAGVAHEIRNPLTAIKARLYTHRKSFAPVSKEYEAVEFVSEEVERLERIVREFLQFARPPEPAPAAVSPADILREVKELLAPELRKRSIELAIAEMDERPVSLDRQQIKQVLINLAQNSAESIGERGRITMRIRRDRKQGAVLFEIEDDGRGIPEEVRDRVFDPFFTTKAAGTGLGLPIAARIVEKHGGSIQYESRLNRGTRFRITFPTKK